MAISIVTVLTIAFLIALTTTTSASKLSEQVTFQGGRNNITHLQIYVCNTTLPKASRPDCEALLADLDEEEDTDEFFCPELCFDEAFNQTVTRGVARTSGNCRLQALTNILGGEDGPDGCDGVCLSLKDVKKFVLYSLDSCSSNSSEVSAVGMSDDGRGYGVKVCLGSEPEEPTCHYPIPSE